MCYRKKDKYLPCQLCLDDLYNKRVELKEKLAIYLTQNPDKLIEHMAGLLVSNKVFSVYGSYPEFDFIKWSRKSIDGSYTELDYISLSRN
jgi:hypothetical protein